jgi:cytochrome P450
MTEARAAEFPLGAAVTLEELEDDPHAVFARMRDAEPVSWVPALNGWVVLRRDLALKVMRESQLFTVDDPRFTTARVVGPSMLSTDGPDHLRHRAAFAEAFKLSPVRERFTPLVAREVDRLLDAMEAPGTGEVRSAYSGPLAAAVVTHALGLGQTDVRVVLAWYEAIVSAVSGLAGGAEIPETARGAFAQLRRAIEEALDSRDQRSLVAAAGGAGGLRRPEVVSNAAVIMFGGIETTDGMIANVLLHLLSHPDQLALVRADAELIPAAVEESLRLEPAAAFVDRYATRRTHLGGVTITPGDLVSVAVTAANRDPEAFPDPDRFDVRRPNARNHLAFAAGPHVCIGMHLARLEAHTAVRRMLERMPDLRLADPVPPRPRGLVFRKPPELRVAW